MRKDNLLYINGKDAWLTWSAMLVDDSYDNLLLPAGQKAYIENNSRSQSGKQIFFSNPKQADRNVQLMFCITCDSKQDYFNKYHSLIAEMRKGLFELKVIPLSTIYRVYLPENGFLSLSSGIGFREGKFSVRLNEPNPANRQSTLLTAYVLSSLGKVLTLQGKILTTK
ncbi:hypothetical protein D0T84_00740 [Dysgonomonas sp. 521]|uniref:hypothetical protein n=1 Tax=Dysgonomonas sp. 521 TaxID=2302932 RepID=UPI0013CFBF7E|nr:hypothetical protein [Dysgonomonas sp. 521]NDV93444.1 hypothetical protein [Dysgonomonas sp. 521]